MRVAKSISASSSRWIRPRMPLPPPDSGSTPAPAITATLAGGFAAAAFFCSLGSTMAVVALVSFTEPFAAFAGPFVAFA